MRKYIDMMEQMVGDNIVDHISNLVKNGNHEGFDPYWKLVADERNLRDDAVMFHISELIAAGFTSGYHPTWELKIVADEDAQEFADDNKSSDQKAFMKNKEQEMLLDNKTTIEEGLEPMTGQGYAHWASFLINGDVGDLSEEELKAANEFSEYMGGNIVDCSDEPFFGTPEYPNGLLKGPCLEYTALIDSSSL